MTKRCAIYTRVSTEHGLEQEFNSLDNQREAAEAYVKSQAHEGWRPRRDRYDDGGFSGGSLERPALHRLLAEVRARRVDVIVVYKVDRLTRSLADFAKLVELFDGHGVSFVSVTQAFNTTTSMGRLTLNVLLSFAQFEREVTGERIRDKIAASKKKGLWMGGQVPLGYRVEARRLVVDASEAETVRTIFSRYVALGSLPKLRDELRAAGLTSRARQRASGEVAGGVAFTVGPLQHILRNRVYLGEINHRRRSYPGEHPAIITHAQFEAVEAQLTEGCNRQSTAREWSGALLIGKLFDERGHPMSPTHTRKGPLRYRYYVSRPPMDGRPVEASSVQRVPATEVERLVLDALRRRASSDATDIDLAATIERVELGSEAIHVMVRGTRSDDAPDRFEPLVLQIPWSRAPQRRHHDLIRVPDREGPARPMRVETRATLLVAVASGRRWLEEIVAGAVASPDAIALREGCTRRQVNATLSLASLAPAIVEAAIAGRLPHGIAMRDLTDLPLCWSEQRQRIGLAP